MSRHVLKPIHYAPYGSWERQSDSNYYKSTICGLLSAGYWGTKKKDLRDVPYSRARLQIEMVTCEKCLVRMIRMLQRQLRRRLAATNGSVTKAAKEGATQVTVRDLRAMVGV